MIAALACALALGCQGEEEHPPEYRPPYRKPLSCAELRQSGFPLSVDQEPACAADGLTCPLSSDAGCDAGEPLARCINKTWVLGCSANADAASP